MANTKQIQVRTFKGLNLNPDLSQLDPGECPDLHNIRFDNDGTPDKRLGVVYAFPNSLGITPISGLIPYYGGLVIVASEQVYWWDLDPGHFPVKIYENFSSPVNGRNISGFVWGTALYLMHPAGLLEIDKGQLDNYMVTVDPYVPTLTISTPPSGGGTPFEQWNLLGRWFKQLFNGDGSTKVYQLALNGLDADMPMVYVGDVLKTPTTDYTFNASSGIVTFVTAPPTGVNNVSISAAKTDQTKKDRINHCRRATIYGGSNDTRVHLYGNEYQGSDNFVYRCALNDPTYWPENDFNRFGDFRNTIAGQVNQYDTSVIIAKKGVWLETFELNADGVASFPTQPLNSEVDCICPNSIQLIDNSPVWLSSNGLMMLTSSQIRSERNVQMVSEKVNTKMIEYSREAADAYWRSAFSADFDGCYYLFAPNFGPGSATWVWNYRTDTWSKWDRLDARSAAVVGGDLYIGTGTGRVLRFKRATEDKWWQDYADTYIDSYLVTKVFGSEDEGQSKLLRDLVVTLRSGSQTSCAYRTNKSTGGSWQDVGPASAFSGSSLPQTDIKHLKANRISHFQLKFSNKISFPMGLLSFVAKYDLQGSVK